MNMGTQNGVAGSNPVRPPKTIWAGSSAVERRNQANSLFDHCPLHSTVRCGLEIRIQNGAALRHDGGPFLLSRSGSLKQKTCKKCGFVWLPRVPHPKQCPKCKSRYWR